MKNMKIITKKVLPFVCEVFFCYNVFSQSIDLGSWNIFHTRFMVTSRLNVFAEAQLRSLKFYDHFHYYEYKGGAIYKFHPYVRAGLGAGKYVTYTEGGNFNLPLKTDELRLWPQLTLLHEIQNVQIEHRYRYEMRWTNNGYKNRYRLRTAVFCYFGPQREGDNERIFQLALSNELFFTNREPYFERDRLNIALTYAFTHQVDIQIGYMYQFDYNLLDEIGRDFFVCGVFIDFFRKEQSREKEVKGL